MKNNTLIKDAAALFAITLVAGFLLGSVFEITKKPIAKAEYNKKQEAYQSVFSEASSFEESDELTKLAKSKENFTDDEEITGVFIDEVLLAKNEKGEEIGYVMSIGSKEGYGGEIDLSVGIDKSGTIMGMEVLSMSETAGLGANCTSEEFKAQFQGIKDSNIEYTKSGKSKENEIDAIGGATITTKAVTKAMNNALAFIYANGAIGQ